MIVNIIRFALVGAFVLFITYIFVDTAIMNHRNRKFQERKQKARKKSYADAGIPFID